MKGLFANLHTRRLLGLVLALAGLMLIVFPSQMRLLLGGSIDFWTAMSGAGFMTGAYILVRVVAGNISVKVFADAFFFASLLSLLVALMHWTPGWIVPSLGAIVIAILANVTLSQFSSNQNRDTQKME